MFKFLRSKSMNSPISIDIQISEPIMKPIFPPLPKFDGIRYDSISSPIFRSGKEASVDTRSDPFHRLFEVFPSGNDFALWGDIGTQTTFKWPGSKVCISFSVSNLFYNSFNPYLTLQFFPIKQQGTCPVMLQIPPFPAIEIGVKNETALIKVLQKHHP